MVELRASGKAARRLRATACFVAIAALGGCAALIPQAPRAIYDLSAPDASDSGRRVSAQILIPPPSAVRALDSDLIAARPTASEYAYLPGAQWSDSLPKLLQMRLLQTFQNSGRVAAVGLPGQGLLIDYQVILDIRAFELTGQTAVTEFAVKLMNDRNGRIVKTTVVRAEVPTVSEGTEAVVAALDAGMDDAFLQIVDWVAAGR